MESCIKLSGLYRTVKGHKFGLRFNFIQRLYGRFFVALKGGEAMYQWLKAYITQFGKDFPLASVIEKNEYEIVRILQECCEAGKEYTAAETSEAE